MKLPQINKLLIFILLLFAVIFSACSSKSAKEKNAASLELIDDQGDTVKLNKYSQKIVCFSPALTEMAASILGEENKEMFAARSQVCNYPLWVKSLPEINTYPLNVEQVYSKKPELIISEVNFIDPQKIQKLRELGIPVYVMDNQSTMQILDNLLIMGKLLNKEKRAKYVVDSLKLEQLEIKNKNQNRQVQKRPKVMALISTEPIYIFGHGTLMEEKVTLAGGVLSLPIELTTQYPKIDRELLYKINPEIILGPSFESMDKLFFSKYPEMKKLDAYKTKNIYSLNEDLASRPSPRYISSIAEISNAIDTALAKGLRPKE